MAPLLALIIAIVVISAVVGMIAQFLNKMNEANAQPARRPPGGANKPVDRDMDRFLAEIDRLRKKNAEAAQQQHDGETAARPQAKPVPRPPEKQPDRPRPRVVAELTEPPVRPGRREKTDAQGFTVPSSPPPPPPPIAVVVPSTPVTRPQDLPVATLVSPVALAQIPGMTTAVRVATLPKRARPTPKTPLARDLINLLNSGNGAVTAIVLMEILGPPKCKQQGPRHPKS